MKVLYVLFALMLVLALVSAGKKKGRGGHRHRMTAEQKNCKSCVKKCLYVDQKTFSECISEDEDTCFDLCGAAEMIPCLECIDECKNTENDDGSERSMRFCVGRASPCHDTCHH